MWSYLTDRWQSATLKARYQRRVQEQLLKWVEESGPQLVSEDPGRWTPLATGASTPTPAQRVESRQQARDMAQSNPHVRNLLRLLEIYVVGPGMSVQAAARVGSTVTRELLQTTDHLWEEFLRVNQRHFSYCEYARRCWRDGEAFLRKFPSARWPCPVRFLDPETIGSPPHEPDTAGILTAPGDIETVRGYQRLNPVSHELLEEITSDEVLHTKHGVDSNEPRGVSYLTPLLDALRRYEGWLDTELQARKLQASIVLWRKVHGSPLQAAALADAQAQAGFGGGSDAIRREKFRAGTILTTAQGTDLQFLQPNTNFGDSMPLGRQLLLCLAAGAGLPEFMLTSDASNSNYASTMVAEGPAVKLFQAEQTFFTREFDRLWEWVMREAQFLGLLPRDFFEHVTTRWTLPQLINRDRPRERMADVHLVEAGVLSRAEVARREGVDPVLMERERCASRTHDEQESAHHQAVTEGP